jgi:hypothetical protein
MTWGNRFRLFFGIIFVVALLGAGLVYLNYSMAHVSSQSAKLQSQSYTVGTDYSGIVDRQYVKEGQHVTTGQQLFEIKSALLQDALAKGSVTRNDLAYSINNDNEIVLKATGNGVISTIDYLEGAFVPAGKEVARITKDNSLYVEARYLLAPPDYARLKSGDYISVTLPNDQHLKASIFDISVVSSNNSAYTLVKAQLNGLGNDTSFVAGTPVSTKLHLRGKTLYDSLKQKVNDLIKPKQ